MHLAIFNLCTQGIQSHNLISGMTRILVDSLDFDLNYYSQINIEESLIVLYSLQGNTFKILGDSTSQTEIKPIVPVGAILSRIVLEDSIIFASTWLKIPYSNTKEYIRYMSNSPLLKVDIRNGQQKLFGEFPSRYQRGNYFPDPIGYVTCLGSKSKIISSFPYSDSTNLIDFTSNDSYWKSFGVPRNNIKEMPISLMANVDNLKKHYTMSGMYTKLYFDQVSSSYCRFWYPGVSEDFDGLYLPSRDSINQLLLVYNERFENIGQAFVDIGAFDVDDIQFYNGKIYLKQTLDENKTRIITLTTSIFSNT